jgi:hypothetical protein
LHPELLGPDHSISGSNSPGSPSLNALGATLVVIGATVIVKGSLL